MPNLPQYTIKKHKIKNEYLFESAEDTKRLGFYIFLLILGIPIGLRKAEITTGSSFSSNYELSAILLCLILILIDLVFPVLDQSIIHSRKIILNDSLQVLTVFLRRKMFTTLYVKIDFYWTPILKA